MGRGRFGPLDRIRAGAWHRSARADGRQGPGQRRRARVRDSLRRPRPGQDHELFPRARCRSVGRRSRAHRARSVSQRTVGLRVRREPGRRALRRPDHRAGAAAGRTREPQLGYDLGSGRGPISQRLVGRDTHSHQEPALQARSHRMGLQRAAPGATEARDRALGVSGPQLAHHANESRGPAGRLAGLEARSRLERAPRARHGE